MCKAMPLYPEMRRRAKSSSTSVAIVVWVSECRGASFSEDAENLGRLGRLSTLGREAMLRYFFVVGSFKGVDAGVAGWVAAGVAGISFTSGGAVVARAGLAMGRLGVGWARPYLDNVSFTKS